MKDQCLAGMEHSRGALESFRSQKQTHALPAALAALLGSQGSLEAALDGEHAWVFTKKELFLWRYADGSSAQVHSRALPYISAGHHFVSITPAQVRVQLPKHACMHVLTLILTTVYHPSASPLQ